MLLLMALFLAAMIPNDFKFITEAPLLVAVLSLRALNLVSIFCLFLAISRQWGPRIYRLLVLGLLIPVVILIILLDLTRPKDYLFGFVFVFLLLSFYYFLLPATLALKTVPSLILSIYEAWSVLFFRAYPDSARLTIVIVLAGVNLLGISNAISLHRLRATEWKYRAKLEDEVRFKRALANSVYDSILLCKDDVVIDYNQNIIDLLGLEPESLRGEKIKDLIRLREGDADILHQGGAAHGELCVCGIVYPVEIQVHTVSVDGELHTGYLFKDRSDELIDIMQSRPSDSAARIMALPLSEREKEIVAKIVEGKSRFKIADELFISDETVKKHTGNIYRKLGIKSKVELIRLVVAA